MAPRRSAAMPGGRSSANEVMHFGIEGPPETSGIPARNGFTVSFVLSPASPALLPPSPAVCLRQLDTA
jgi:hypothetical protein